MKGLKFFAMMLVVTLGVGLLSSCSKDDDEGSISGYYVDSDRETFVKIDNSTLYKGVIDDDSYWASTHGCIYWKRNGKCYRVGDYWTFIRKGNTLVIDNGSFATVKGNKVYYGSGTYTKE